MLSMKLQKWAFDGMPAAQQRDKGEKRTKRKKDFCVANFLQSLGEKEARSRLIKKVSNMSP